MKRHGAAVGAPGCSLLEKHVFKRLRSLDCSHSKVFTGEGTIGVYGTHTYKVYHQLVDNLLAHGDLPASPSDWDESRLPVLLDFGAGIGRVMLYFQARNLVAHAYGVEFDPIKVRKARDYMATMLQDAALKEGLPVRSDPPTMIQDDLLRMPASQLEALMPTLGFTFWTGFTPDIKEAIGNVFRRSETMQLLVVVDHGNHENQILSALAGADEPKDIFIERKLTGMNTSGNKSTYVAFFVKKKKTSAADLQ